jgi:hypothetical protein
MCSGGSQPAPVTPAPAPPPAEPAPEETEIGKLRRDQEQATFGGKQLGDLTRVDRSATGGVRGGSGSRNPTGSGLEM